MADVGRDAALDLVEHGEVRGDARGEGELTRSLDGVGAVGVFGKEPDGLGVADVGEMLRGDFAANVAELATAALDGATRVGRDGEAAGIKDGAPVVGFTAGEFVEVDALGVVVLMEMHRGCEAVPVSGAAHGGDDGVLGEVEATVQIEPRFIHANIARESPGIQAGENEQRHLAEMRGVALGPSEESLCGGGFVAVDTCGEIESAGRTECFCF